MYPIAAITLELRIRFTSLNVGGSTDFIVLLLSHVFKPLLSMANDQNDGNGLSLATGTQIKGWALGSVIPVPSCMSTVPLTFQSKH